MSEVKSCLEASDTNDLDWVCPVCGLGFDDCMSPPSNLLEWFDRRQSTFLKYFDKGQGHLSHVQLLSFAAHEKHGDL